jgi:hypothetical protein
LLGDERAAMEAFFAVLAERGIRLGSVEEAKAAAERFAGDLAGSVR